MLPTGRGNSLRSKLVYVAFTTIARGFGVRFRGKKLIGPNR